MANTTQSNEPKTIRNPRTDTREQQPERIQSAAAKNQDAQQEQQQSQTSEQTIRSAPSKAAVAREIFNETMDQPRRDVINRFIQEAGLTKAGASTYYQNFKKEAGMVNERTKPNPIVHRH